jgi:hypothetical protein
MLTPPVSAGSAVFALDSSGQAGITIPADGIANPFGYASNFAGLILINDPQLTGATALFICGGGFMNKIGEGNTIAPAYSTVKDTATKINVYIAPGNVVEIQNKWAGTMRACIMAMRVRDSA